MNTVRLFFLLILTVYVFGGRKHYRRANRKYENKCKKKKTDPCDNFYCANGGFCFVNSYDYYRSKSYQSSAMCIGTGEWHGDRCDDNPCVGIKCNSGTCYANSRGSPVCSCPEGCLGETCGDEDSSSCAAADGVCSPNDGSCPAERLLDIPCCNGNICCKTDPCDNKNCNSGTCYADSTGSAVCCCPEGCSGDTCGQEDISICAAADGVCSPDDGSCPEDRILGVPCCNGNICCRTDPCDNVNCNEGTCYADSTGSAVCCCPEGCSGETCKDEDSSSCAAAAGVCSSIWSCTADRILDIPCCNGNICCRENSCDTTDCNKGTCYASNTGSTLCQCPEGCTGASCDDDSACNAAYGKCIDGENGCEFSKLDIPCCNDKYCCQVAIESVTCEGSTMTLSCDPGFVISIVYADYGRDDFTTCPDEGIRTDDCSVPNSLSVVKLACNGQQTCSMPVTDGYFGETDPCPETYKFLRVSYRCVLTN